MKTSPAFKTVINEHLQQLASTDSLFAESLKKPAKNIDDCCTYIVNQVQKSGQNGFADEEIFGMAIHYYDEDNINIGKAVNAKVVVNHHVEPSKKKATVEAAQQTKEMPSQPASVKKPVAKKPIVSNQQSLF